MLAALALSREGEQKTILQVYVSSISAHEFLLGKIAAFFIIALAEWVLAVLVAIPLFDLKIVGDPTPLLVGTVFYLFCNVSFGVMVGVSIPNQAAAIQAVAGVQFLLSFLLSGFIFPVSNVPAELRWIFCVRARALFHRDYARCLCARRRLARRVECALDAGADRIGFLFQGVAEDAPYAG